MDIFNVPENTNMPDIGQVPTVYLPKLCYLGKGYEVKKHVGISFGSRGALKQKKQHTHTHAEAPEVS